MSGAGGSVRQILRERRGRIRHDSYAGKIYEPGPVGCLHLYFEEDIRMKKKILAILSRQGSYAQRLAGDINRNKDYPWNAAAYTDEHLLKDSSAGGKTDVILMEEDMYDPEREDMFPNPGIRLILLTEDETDLTRNPPCITQYQSVREIMEDILELCGSQRKAPAAAAGIITPGLVGVYSPVGRCGKTSFCLTLGLMLAEQEKTLYLNMENWHGFYDLMKINPAVWKGGDISDLIYAIRTRPDQNFFRFSQIVQSFKDLDYIMPVRGELDMRNVSEEEWEKVISECTRIGGYRKVILDMGSQTDDVFKIMGCCSRVYIPYLDDAVSKAKIRQFRRALSDFRAEGVAENIRYLHLPEWKEQMADDFPMSLVRNSYGAYVRKMLTEEK